MATTQELLDAAATGDLRHFKQIAGDYGYVEVFRRICETFKDKEEQSAFHCAAEAGKTQICRFLVEDVKVDVNMKTDEGETLLLLAVKYEQLPTAEYLIKKGADVKLSDFKGMTPLHAAAKKGLKKLTRLLISQGAEIEANSDDGTPLQLAVANGKKEVVRILLDNNSDPNFTPPLLVSPIGLAVCARSFDCLDMLLKAGADPNSISAGMTTLAYAASESENEFLKFLLKAGADPNIVSMSGMTPLEYAAMSCNYEGITILLPRTSPLPFVPNWSFHGIMTYCHSKEAKDQRELKNQQKFQLAKQRGLEAIQRNDYLNAMACYSETIYLNPTDAAVLSNRSLCWARLNEGKRALSDAEACVQLRPNWQKAHYRVGVAWMLLKNYPRATEAFTQALRLDPENKEIQKAFKEAVEAESDM